MLKLHEPEVLLIDGDFSLDIYRQRANLVSKGNFKERSDGIDFMATLFVDAIKEQENHERKYSLSSTKS